MMGRPTLPLLTALLVVAAMTSGCRSFIRTERDAYTITTVDTTTTSVVHNAPGERDNGIVYPSSRTVDHQRTVVQRDSVVERDYPNVIRLGLFEGIGTIGTTRSGDARGFGLFGLHPSADELFNRRQQSSSPIFSGGIYRLGIAEWRLHWFNEASSWSWGLNALEAIVPDTDAGNTMVGAGVLTLTKRFYLREAIPYTAIRISAGFAALPSTYVHLTASADLGSLGGLNLRAYSGFAFGMGRGRNGTNFMGLPYVGLGASVLDFLQREPELDRELKDQQHSAWSIGLMEFTFVGSDQESSLFAPYLTGAEAPLLKGVMARLAPTTIALPLFDRRLAFGTSLITFMGFGGDAFAFAALPLRLSYVMHPLDETLVVEPFVELLYAPSTAAHLGIRALVPAADVANLHVTLGYVTGNTGLARSVNIDNRPNASASFNAVYLGIGASFLERLFHRNELRYPHE